MNYVVVTVRLPSGAQKDLALPLEAPVGLLADRLAHRLGLIAGQPYTFFVTRESRRIRIWRDWILGRFPLLQGEVLSLAPDSSTRREAGNEEIQGKRILVGAFGQQFPLKESETIIGRTDPARGIFPDIDLTPFDPERTVSRQHARIIYREGKYYLEDLGSVNGTRHNGRLLSKGHPAVLQPGDRIEFGRGVTVFEFQASSSKLP